MISKNFLENSSAHLKKKMKIEDACACGRAREVKLPLRAKTNSPRSGRRFSSADFYFFQMRLGTRKRTRPVCFRPNESDNEIKSLTNNTRASWCKT